MPPAVNIAGLQQPTTACVLLPSIAGAPAMDHHQDPTPRAAPHGVVASNVLCCWGLACTRKRVVGRMDVPFMGVAAHLRVTQTDVGSLHPKPNMCDQLATKHLKGKS